MKPVLFADEMRAADRHTIEEKGVPSQTLMERAGAAIAAEAESMLAERGGKEVLAVCGTGNNGGDGWCAARLLLARGFSVTVYPTGEKCSEDCRVQREKFPGPVADSFPARRFDLVIDAVFGTGFHGVPRGTAADAIRAVNACGAPVLAADIPSGLGADSGTGALCVRADRTVAVGERKAGHYLEQGQDLCGEVVRADIGIELPVPPRGALCEAGDFAPLFAPRMRNTNKGSYGRAVILGGSLRYSGAPFLSAQAALRCGCGYTEMAVPQELFVSCIGRIPSAILTAGPSSGGFLVFDEPFLRRLCGPAAAIAFGMGAGVSGEIFRIAAYLVRNFPGTLILDADALNSLAEYGTDVLRERHAGRVVLTPHLGEFARLTGRSAAETREDAVRLAAEFAAETDCTVLLKSNVSAVCGKEGIRYIAEGTPALAKGGSGDLLAGMTASLAARGVPAFEAASCASFLLGRAGRRASAGGTDHGVTADDLLAALPAAERDLAEAGKN